MLLPLEIDGLMITIERKKIKHLYLRVKAPHVVAISAPWNTPLIAIKRVILQRMDWITQRSAELNQAIIINCNPIAGYWLWGEYYPVVVTRTAEPSSVTLVNQQLKINIKLHSKKQPEEMLVAFYRIQLQQVIPVLLHQWLPQISVNLKQWRIKKMRTRWGTCNISERRIWLNLELAKYPLKLLEYVVVHELIHLHERYHNQRFLDYMDYFLPDWRSRRQALNQPLIACDIKTDTCQSS